MLKRSAEQERHDNVKTAIGNPFRKFDCLMREASQFVQQDDTGSVSLPEERKRTVVCRERFLEKAFDYAHRALPSSFRFLSARSNLLFYAQPIFDRESIADLPVLRRLSSLNLGMDHVQILHSFLRVGMMFDRRVDSVMRRCRSSLQIRLRRGSSPFLPFPGLSRFLLAIRH
jgi:hypothetical protein